MKTRIMILLSAIALLNSACERTLDFVGIDEEKASDVTISSVAVVGTPLIVYLSKANTIDEATFNQYFYDIASPPIKDGDNIDYYTKHYFRMVAISEGQVSVEVSGGKQYSLTFNKNDYGYSGEYIPQEGDVINIKATVNGQEVTAQTSVPQKPKIEISDYEVIPGNPYKEINGYIYETDTIMRITCHIAKESEKQYYRLRVRSERDGFEWLWYMGEKGSERVKGQLTYHMQDVFFSDDKIFADQRLTSNSGGWPPYFSNVFDDNLIGTDGYTFTVDSPKMPQELFAANSMTYSKEGNPPLPPRVMIELQAISPELYHYLKSAELYRLTYNDAYTEPVQIYSNVQNGWGIFGALSYDRHFIEYGE